MDKGKDELPPPWDDYWLQFYPRREPLILPRDWTPSKQPKVKLKRKRELGLAPPPKFAPKVKHVNTKRAPDAESFITKYGVTQCETGAITRQPKLRPKRWDPYAKKWVYLDRAKRKRRAERKRRRREERKQWEARYQRPWSKP